MKKNIMLQNTKIQNIVLDIYQYAVINMAIGRLNMISVFGMFIMLALYLASFRRKIEKCALKLFILRHPMTSSDDGCLILSVIR